VLILKRVRELVRDEQLADEIAAGEEADDPDPRRLLAKPGRRQRERLVARVVEGGDLVAVELASAARARCRAPEAEARVDDAQPVELAGPELAARARARSARRDLRVVETRAGPAA
jgi:hypothetical protein